MARLEKQMGMWQRSCLWIRLNKVSVMKFHVGEKWLTVRPFCLHLVLSQQGCAWLHDCSFWDVNEGGGLAVGRWWVYSDLVEETLKNSARTPSILRYSALERNDLRFTGVPKLFWRCLSSDFKEVWKWLTVDEGIIQSHLCSTCEVNPKITKVR